MTLCRVDITITIRLQHYSVCNAVESGLLLKEEKKRGPKIYDDNYFCLAINTAIKMRKRGCITKRLKNFTEILRDSNGSFNFFKGEKCK